MPKMLFTTIPNGSCIMTMLWGKSDPKFILAYKGHHLDRNNNVVKTEGWADEDPRWESMGIQIPSDLEQFWIDQGIYPISVVPWRWVVSWDMAWAEWSHVGEDGKPIEGRRLRPRSEETSIFMVKNFSYAFRMKEVETSLGIKVDLDFTVYVEGVNPEQALARTDDWFRKFEGQIRERVKNFIGAKELFDLMSEEKKARPLLALMHPLQSIKDLRLAELAAAGKPMPIIEDMPRFGKYVSDTTVDVDGHEVSMLEGLGIRITGATIDDFGLAASEAELQALMSSTTQQAIKNDNIRTEADARKDAAKKLGEGEAAAIEAVTVALSNRWTRVNSLIAQSPDGTRLAMVEVSAAASVKVSQQHAEAMRRVAEAVERNQKLTTVVFPNGGAQPVVPLPAGVNPSNN